MTFKKSVIALATVTVLAVGGVMAQATGHAPGSGRHGKRMDYFATYLDMTDAQKAQAKSIVEASRTATQPLRQELKQNRQAMMEAVKANKPEADLKQIADSQAAIASQLAVQKALTGEKLWALLTPDQQAKADKLQGRFLQMREHHNAAQ